LQQLWPDAFVEEGNLAKHVSLLRKALSADSNGTAYIETAPKKGYRFVVQVTALENGAASKSMPMPAPPPPAITPPVRPRSQTRALWIVAATVAIAGALALGGSVILRPTVSPNVLRTVQVTHSGRVEWVGGIFTDGARVYFAERRGGRYTLAWVSTA